MRFTWNVSHWDLKQPAFYHGHFAHLDFVKFGFPSPIYVNVIRKPLDRMISYYYFLRYGDDFRPHLVRKKQGNKMVAHTQTKSILMYVKYSLNSRFVYGRRLMIASKKDWLNVTPLTCGFRFLFSVGTTLIAGNTSVLLRPFWFWWRREKYGLTKQVLFLIQDTWELVGFWTSQDQLGQQIFTCGCDRTDGGICGDSGSNPSDVFQRSLTVVSSRWKHILLRFIGPL